MKFSIAFFLLCSGILGQASQKNEGLFPHFPMKEALQVMSYFLPPNPTICLIADNALLYEKCLHTWPLAHFVFLDEIRKAQPDFVWIAKDRLSKIEVKNLQYALEKAIVVYKTENTQDEPHPLLRLLIKASNLSFCSKWQEDNQEVGSFFLATPLYNALLRGLSFDSKSYNTPLLYTHPIFLDPFLVKLPPKTKDHSFDTVDCVYIINLEERPEKFALSCKQLNPYKIHPYRFPAVNGWKLSIEEINNLGIRTLQMKSTEDFIGTVFKNIEGKEIRTHELLKAPDTTYFGPGMTRGSIGIILSHLSVLQDAYDANYDTIWVMEDDIQVIVNPHIILPLLKKLTRLDPNWDILFTDKDTKDKQGNYVPCQGLSMRPNVPIAPLDSFLKKAKRIDKDFSSTGMRYGAYSMILRRSGMKKILDYYKKHALFLPYDADFWLESSLKMYHTNEDIISTIPDALSDNEKPSY